MDRRDFLKQTSLAAASFAATPLSAQTSAPTPLTPSPHSMSYTLAPLPYAHNALEPHIDQATMEIHHGKHHNAYVTNLNAALAKEAGFNGGSDVDALIADLSKVPESIRTAVRNNAGATPTILSSGTASRPTAAANRSVPSAKPSPRLLVASKARTASRPSSRSLRPPASAPAGLGSSSRPTSPSRSPRPPTKIAR